MQKNSRRSKKQGKGKVEEISNRRRDYVKQEKRKRKSTNTGKMKRRCWMGRRRKKGMKEAIKRRAKEKIRIGRVRI